MSTFVGRRRRFIQRERVFCCSDVSEALSAVADSITVNTGGLV